MFKCLGLWPKNPSIEILDRYIRIGWDFNVNPADQSCILDVFEDEKKKISRWETEIGQKINQSFKSVGASFIE